MTRRLETTALLVAALVVAIGSTSALAEVPAASGTVRLDGGKVAHYTAYPNRNALADAVLIGNAILARTDAGTLIRFDRSTFAMVKESVGPIAATALGRGERGAVLVGYADGRVGRLDPSSLEIAEVARVSGRVQWVGVVGKRLVAVAEKVEPFKFRGTEFPVPASIVHEVGSDRTYRLDPKEDPRGNGRADAFLLDRKGRLWMGGDRGDLGGWCAFVDFEAGRLQVIPGRVEPHNPRPFWLGVMGFTERPDGQVWAHGGTIRGVLTEGFIWRVDSGTAEELYRVDNIPPGEKERQRRQFARAAIEAQRRVRDEPPALNAPPIRELALPDPEPASEEPPADRPIVPISRILDDGTGEGVVVVAANRVYRAGAKLGRWRKDHELKLQARWPFASAPVDVDAVRAVISLGKERWTFATAMDGLVSLVDGQETGHAVPGQLGAGTIARLARSSDGVLALAGAEDGSAWRYRGGRWDLASYRPPYEADPAAPDASGESKASGWYGTRVMVGRDGSIVSVSSSSWIDPGTLLTARWVDGHPRVLGRQVAGFHPGGCFLAPGGILWQAEAGILRRFEGGKWVETATVNPESESPRPDWSDLQLDLVAIHDDGPPWIFHDPEHRLLLRLNYGEGFREAKLTIESPPELRTRRVIRDAIAWKPGELLLATDDGLRTLTMADGRLWTPRLTTGGRPVARLARDARGRLWLGGDEGLSVLEADGKTLHHLDDVPLIGRSRIQAIAADPDHPDGALIAIEGRGVTAIHGL